MTARPAARPPWDRGLQIERTRLAWGRTSLSGLAFCLVTARLIAIYSWPVAVAVAMIAVATTAAVGWTASRRYRRADAAVRSAGLLPGAISFAAVTLLVVVTGIGALVFWTASWTLGAVLG